MILRFQRKIFLSVYYKVLRDAAIPQKLFFGKYMEANYLTRNAFCLII